VIAPFGHKCCLVWLLLWTFWQMEYLWCM